jgi:hypothetical protein
MPIVLDSKMGGRRPQESPQAFVDAVVEPMKAG